MSKRAPNTVQEFASIHSLDSKICVLEGGNLRQLRDGLGLCSPAIIQPEQRQRKTFWKAISKVLLDVCDRNILTSEVTRSEKMMKALQEKFLDKLAQKLMGRLSNFQAKAVETAITNLNFPVFDY